MCINYDVEGELQACRRNRVNKVSKHINFQVHKVKDMASNRNINIECRRAMCIKYKVHCECRLAEETG